MIFFTNLALGVSFQVVSAHNPVLAAATGAGGDSCAPSISTDGRHVLFASTADNLIISSNSLSSLEVLPTRVNVFLRDRMTGTTTLVSVSTNGFQGGNGDSWPIAISTNGQLAVFESTAGDLVTGDSNGARDIFLRNLPAGTTTLLSVSTNGTAGNGGSRNAVATRDGRFVAFTSSASNLVADDTNGLADVFVRDTLSNTTTLVSVGALPSTSSAIGASDSPEITADGRFIVFMSTASNLVSGVTSTNGIYVRDLTGGLTVLVSTNSAAIAASILGTSNIVSCNSAISADGRYVAFEAFTNGVRTAATPGLVLRHDLQTGFTDTVFTNAHVPIMPPEDIRALDCSADGRFVAFIANTNISGTNTACVMRWDAQTGSNVVVSLDMDGNVQPGTSCDWPLMDPSGRFIAFFSNATNLTTDLLAGEFHCYRYDALSNSVQLVDMSANGASASTIADAIAFSEDGRLVAFVATGGDMVPNDFNRASDVFIRDLANANCEMVSVRNAALPCMAANGLSSVSTYSASGDGRFVAFVSDADDLVDGDTNGLRDVFVRDLAMGTNILVSVATNGLAGNGISSEPCISPDGRYVSFSSTASNLAPGDTNKLQDIFVRDLQLGTTILASVATNQTTSGNGASLAPIISRNGTFLLFTSAANNLVTNSIQSFSGNFFLRNLSTGKTVALTAGGAVDATLTPDGSFVAFTGSQSFLGATHLYVRDILLGTNVYSDLSSSSPSTVVISPDGQRVAYVSSLSPMSLNLLSLPSKSNQVLLSASRLRSLSFSADGRFLAYSTPAGSTLQGDVFLYDSLTATNILVSRDMSGTVASGSADSPRVSANGRFVAYRSAATNLFARDSNLMGDVVLFDRLNNSTFLVSSSKNSSSTANRLSTMPIFSGDGSVLAFNSWASDLQSGDYNQNGDIFALALDSLVVADTDNDGLDDQWETDYFGSLAQPGFDDFDGDGANNLLEFQSGTNPANPLSAFKVAIAAPVSPGLGAQLKWPTSPWRTCRVEYKNDLKDSAWLELAGAISLHGTNATTIDPSPSPTNRFYRVVLSP